MSIVKRGEGKSGVRETSATWVQSSPFDDQRPGTSGLRKRMTRFQQSHYLENFVQAIFDCCDGVDGGTLVLGGDGRYFNSEACNTIMRMAAANGWARVLVGRNGLMSTPAVSHVIRKYQCVGGIILSASHNPGGPEGDFGIKYNGANGGSAPESVTDAIYARTRALDGYHISDVAAPDLSEIGIFDCDGMTVGVVDPVADYADLMETLFDFGVIKDAVKGGLRLRFDAMSAVTGPYAHEIFEDRLGFAKGSVINGTPDESFGGGHPDPNIIHARQIYDEAMGENASDLAAASDGDGDRNLIIGKGHYVAPSDSLAVIAANAHLAPAFADGVKGVARSMPTSRAVDSVAQALGIESFETPTGWKFFGNLLDADKINLCGEESAGTGADHLREKDGLWAVLMWLTIVAKRRISVAEIMADHWARFGRHYYGRFDYEEIESDKAQAVIDALRASLGNLNGMETALGKIDVADEFSYRDPVDDSVSQGQGIRVMFESGSRFVVRLSGTGTVGATLRLYLERYEPSVGTLDLEPQMALSGLADFAVNILRLEELTGRVRPDVVT